MEIVTWNMGPKNMEEFGTQMSHLTLSYLMNNDVITKEQHEHLASTLMVLAVRNNKSMGQRILSRLFKIEDKPNDYTFVVVAMTDEKVDDTD